MKISRRNFLKGSATTLFLAGFNFPVLANAAKKKNLVIIMLRGGMDGLCAVPIIGDKNFEKRRKDRKKVKYLIYQYLRDFLSDNFLDIYNTTLISLALPRLDTCKSISKLKGEKKSRRNRSKRSHRACPT